MGSGPRGLRNPHRPVPELTHCGAGARRGPWALPCRWRRSATRASRAWGRSARGPGVPGAREARPAWRPRRRHRRPWRRTAAGPARDVAAARRKEKAGRARPSPGGEPAAAPRSPRPPARARRLASCVRSRRRPPTARAPPGTARGGAGRRSEARPRGPSTGATLVRRAGLILRPVLKPPVSPHPRPGKKLHPRKLQRDVRPNQTPPGLHSENRYDV